MPRDVLTLDIEIDPARIAQQREQIREIFTQGAQQGVQSFAPGVMGGPMGGMAPNVPAFPGQTFGQNFGQALFPGYFAPPTSYMDDFANAGAIHRERRFQDFGFNVAQTGIETGAEIAGGGVGALLGGGVGRLLGGPIGGALGMFGGGLLGASLAGGAAGQLTGIGRDIYEGDRGIQNALLQFGFRGGLGTFTDEGGSERLQSMSMALGGDAARNPMIAMAGIDPRKFTQQVVQTGLQENLFGQVGGDDVESQTQEFRDRVQKTMQNTLKVMQSFHVTTQEALQIMTDLKRQGANDPEQMGQEVGLLSSAFRFGVSPSEMMAATAGGSSMARQNGLSGLMGRREATVETIRLAEMRQQGFLGEETVQAGGGVGNLALGIQGGAQRQLGQGGILRDLVFASMTEGGGIDIEKLRELSRSNPLEARQAAAKNFFNFKDPIQAQEEFEYNMPDIMNQITTEDPGLISGMFSQQVQRAAGLQARLTGRPVTQAGVFRAAQTFFGMDQNTARAFAQSRGASAADDPMGLMRESVERTEEDLEARSRDPLVQVRAAVASARENIGAPVVQAFERKLGEGYRAGSEALKSGFRTIMGKEGLSETAKEEELDALLKQYNRDVDGGAKKSGVGESSETVSGGSGADVTMVKHLESLLNVAKSAKDALVIAMGRLTARESGNGGGSGTNDRTKATGSTKAIVGE